MIIQLGDTQVELYDSIKTMPAVVAKEFRATLANHTEVKSSFEGLEERKSELKAYLQQGYLESKVEVINNIIDNLTMTPHMIYDKVDLSHRALGWLIKSIGGSEITDRSDEALDTHIKKLSDLGLTQGVIDELIESVKKKLDTDSKFFFPHRYSKQLEHCTAILSHYIELGNEVFIGESKIQTVNKYFVRENEPHKYSPGVGNFLVELDNEFESLCFLLEKNGVKDPARITEFEFLMKLDIIEREARKSK